MFTDRKDAGKKLAQRLIHYKNQDVLVLAIPRGGVPVGYEVAQALSAEFNLIIARKLPFPYNPETGFGAIAEDGSIVFLSGVASHLHPGVVDTIIQEQKKEIQRRIKILRRDQPLPQINGRITVLVDDGIAMGSSMLACIKLCHQNNPEQLFIAAPVSSPEVARAINRTDGVDDTFILERPKFFSAVAQVYESWYDVPDHEVIEIMNEWRKEHNFSR